jgi:hypothetical protein
MPSKKNLVTVLMDYLTFIHQHKQDHTDAMLADCDRTLVSKNMKWHLMR